MGEKWGGSGRVREEEKENVVGEEERLIIKPHQRQLQIKGWDRHVIFAVPRENNK